MMHALLPVTLPTSLEHRLDERAASAGLRWRYTEVGRLEKGDQTYMLLQLLENMRRDGWNNMVASV